MNTDSELKQKTTKGLGWSFADNMLGQGIVFVVGLVLARLLSPQEYGLIGIVLIFIALFNSMVDSGFSNALIRKNDATQRDYNTVFLSNLLTSLVLYSLLFIAAPAIADFFKQKELQPLLRVMGIIVVINAFAIIQSTLLVKRVDFKTQTKISFIASSISGAAGIGMAFAGYGVWSLAGQQLTRQLLYSLFLWVFSRWRPNWEFSKDSFRELFGFGWKLLVSGLIDTLWREIYQVVIFKFYSPATLGQYTRAKQFNDIFSSNLTNVVQRVSYPVLSSIQNDRTRLKAAYRRLIKATMLVAFVCMLGLAAIAEPMIVVLIGEKWLPAAAFLQIICLSGMLYPLHAINLNMLQVEGRSDILLWLEIIKKTVAIGPLMLGIFVDIYWMLWGSVFTSFFAFYLNTYFSGRFIGYSMADQLKDIQPAFCIAVFMALCVYALSFIPVSPFILLTLQLVVGAALLLGLCEWTKLNEYLEIKSLLMSVVNKIRHNNT